MSSAVQAGGAGRRSAGFKRCGLVARFTLTLLLLMAAAAAPASAATPVFRSERPLAQTGQPTGGEALIVYGREWNSEDGRERLMELYRMLRGSYSAASFIRGGDAQLEQLKEADLVVVAGGAEEPFRRELLPQAGLAEGRTLLLDTADGLGAAARQLGGWLDEGGRTAPAYALLSGVSPLLDLEELERKSAWLHERGIPFWMELRPLFTGGDSPSLDGYYELLRRMQERGGVPLLGPLGGWTPPDEWSSYLSGNEVTGATDTDDVSVLSARSMYAYVSHGIYPAGLAGPPDLLFDPEWSALASTADLFVEGTGWKGYSRDLELAEAWRGRYAALAPAAGAEGAASLPQSSSRVFAVEAGWTMEEFQAALETEMERGVAFADPAAVDSRIEWEEQSLVRRDGQALLNGSVAFWTAPEPPGQSVAPPADGKLTTVNRGVQSVLSVLLVVSVIVVGAFTAAFVAGRQINRRKHLR
ncbi:hypothetical protein HGI30_10680 [Paenibacillus albicereus]|uniref:Uncharacterized protein n=1 Tax=Paenibacillus albicereus TaxID=2726185 RepID=A0A6H2GXW0_9BACL|nr:hypothetical protein [Paenibacillus albicereus]QJC51968.1 hypothetical protein HGI30_10680 [Paenibacillus albicereus]